MKKARMKILLTLTLGLLLCSSAAAWAGEASFFHQKDKLLGRVYTEQTADGTYSLILEVRDAINQPPYMTLLDLAVSPYEGAPDSFLDDPFTTDIQNDPYWRFVLHGRGLNGPDFVISFDSDTDTLYIFCTNGLKHIMKVNVGLSASPGACGAANNTCTYGSVIDVADSSTQYLWQCQGDEGTAAASCSARIPVAGRCGTAKDTCAYGSFIEVQDSSTYYLWQCQGDAGTTAASCSSLIPVAGRCGTAKDTCAYGSFVDVADTATHYQWQCQGDTGTQAPSCSALIPTGTPDLDFTRSYGFVLGITPSGCAYNNTECSVTLSIRNTGNGTASNFNVKAWLSLNGNTVDSTSKLIGTWNVASLAPGGTLTNKISGILSGLAVHVDYTIVIKIDADNQVTTETNKANNTHSFSGVVFYR